MRLRRFGLHAFGPFTETELDLSGPAQGGLHVIFGRNEAGKSTALRAVSGLLFGIGERTPDAHIHPARELRLSAMVEEGERTLCFVRRKRRKDSLRSLSDEPLPEAELQQFLHGVDATVFHTLFGLDHERLKLGGQALLTGHGDVGASLFDAGTAGSGIHQVLLDLSKECDALFKARASKPSLNAAIANYRVAKRKSRDEVRLPEKYLAQLSEVERAKARRHELSTRRVSLREQYERLERVFSAQPIVSRREQCLAELARLGPVPALPEDSTEQRREIEALLSNAARDIQQSEREIARRREQLQALPPATDLVELPKHYFHELRDKVGIHRKAARDLPNVRGQIKQAEVEAERILRRMGQAPSLEQAERLRLDSARIALIRRLARERAVLVQSRASAEARLADAQHELGQKRQALQACGAPLETLLLESALGEARGVIEIEARLGELEVSLAEVEQRRLQLAPRLFEAEPPKAGATVPELEAIETFATRAERLERRLEQLALDRRHAQAEVAEAARHIETIQRQGEVPSEQELAQARHERSRGLEVVMQSAGDPAALEAAVTEYKSLVGRADELADRLRREATRVAEVAHYRVTREHFQERLQLATEQHRAALAEQQDFERQWTTAWEKLPIVLGPPREMLSWRRRFDEWQALELERVRLEREVQSISRRRGASLELLRRQLPEGAPSTSSGALLEYATQVLNRAKRAELERQRLELEVERLEHSVEREARAVDAAAPPLAAWAEQWERAVEPLGLEPEPGTDEVLAVLDDLVELMRKLDELPHNRRRVAGMERDARAFEAALAPLVERHAPDLLGLPVDEAAEQLAERYQEAVRELQDRERLQAELSEREAELDAQRERLSEVRERLRLLLERAGARDLEELVRLEQTWRLGRELTAKRRELEDQLIDQSGSTDVESIVAEASAVDRPALVVQRDELKAELEEVEGYLRDVYLEIDRLERGLEYYTDETAALAAQNLEQRAAETRELMDRYLRVRLAKTILEREIARYRERHQGPVLSRASLLFQRLTLERYQGLRVGLEARTLGCVRADGEEVGVAQLSEGTQYQLYLALRLATLEHYLEGKSPIPLVFDDLLIHFDDERAAAAFAVLGELARRVQILYFTHLSRDLTLSEQVVDASVLRHHRLVAVRPSELELGARPG